MDPAIKAEFDKIHERFGLNDRKFESIDGQFRTVHASFNLVAKELNRLGVLMEDQKATSDILMEKIVALDAKTEWMRSIDAKVDQHDVRISALEQSVKKSRNKKRDQGRNA